MMEPLAFILKFLFDVYLFVVVVRLLLQLNRANFYNPFCQLIVTLTEPLRPLLQNLKIRPELTLVLVLFVLEYLKVGLLLLIQAGAWPGTRGALLWVLGESCSQIVYVLFFSVLVNILLSWIPLPQTQLLREVLSGITEPLLRPMRRVLPLIAGFDLSPLPVLLGLQILDLFVFNPLVAYGASYALRGV